MKSNHALPSQSRHLESRIIPRFVTRGAGILGILLTLAVEVLSADDAGMVWCDGRRGIELVPGARVRAFGSQQRLKLARLSRGPFTDRLVAKFGLPVRGWRGGVRLPE